MTDPLLQVTDLTVDFAPHTATHGRSAPVVDGVNLSIATGEVLGLVGSSGAGKSLTALALMGLLPPDATVSGQVRLSGRSLLPLNDREWSELRGRRLAMVFQEAALNPVRTVGDQVAEAIRIHDRSATRRRAFDRAVELLDLVGVGAGRARDHPHEFSGGMRQRVMIAMAMANDPDLMIADEPTSALDATVAAQVLDVLRRAREATGAALLLVTHDLGVVAGHADRVVVLEQGRVAETASVDDLFHRPSAPATISLLRAVPDPLAARPAPVTVAPAPRHRGDAEEADVLLRIEGLHHTYRSAGVFAGGLLGRRPPGVHAVDGIDLTVHRGETVAIVGESGSGKTTTVRCLLDLVAPQAGRIVLAGHDIATLDPAGRRLLRSRMQPVLQDTVDALDPRLRVTDILAEPLGVAGPSPDRDRLTDLLGVVDLAPDLLDRYPHELSGGQRQRVGIARALATNPDLLVLDEPVSSLDVTTRAVVLDLLQDLTARLALSCLLVAHDLVVVRRLADTVAVMYVGKLVESGPVADVLTAPLHPYTRALVSAIPIPDPRRERTREHVLLDGDPSTAMGPGCHFAARCPLRRTLAESDRQLCVAVEPTLRNVGKCRVACHHVDHNVHGGP